MKAESGAVPIWSRVRYVSVASAPLIHERNRTIRPTEGIVCPSWCDAPNCRGEHSGTVGDGPVPATASLPCHSKSGGVYIFPTVTIGLYELPADHSDPAVTVWIASEDIDTQADLRLHEAKELLVELEPAVAILEAQA